MKLIPFALYYIIIFPELMTMIKIKHYGKYVKLSITKFEICQMGNRVEVFQMKNFKFAIFQWGINSEIYAWFIHLFLGHTESRNKKQ